VDNRSRPQKIHIVKPGEYLASIAKDYKFSRWETIYKHPDNAEFRRRRPNPNVVYPGDRLVIPDKEECYEDGATEQRHTFRLKTPKLFLRIVVRDDEGEILANEPYTLKVGDNDYADTTNDRGLLEKEIPIGVRAAELRLENKDFTIPLQIGDLDPIDNNDDTSKIVTGVQARLNNLGFFCGRIDDNQGPKTTDAIRAFQRQVLGRIEPDGQLDRETREALVREHGS
jgi:hypothetical protein